MSDTDDFETVAPYRWERPADRGEVDSEIRWPRAEKSTPPPELGWRARRRWQKAAAAEQRQRTRATVAGWRAQNADGLGVIVLIGAIVLAAFIFWPRPSVPARPAAPAPVDAAPAPVTTAAPATQTPGNGADTGVPAVPAYLDSPAGRAVNRFLLGYATYNPSNPDPVGTWVSAWSADATPQLADDAAGLAPVLWADAVKQRVSVIADHVGAGTRTADNGTTVTWELDVVRARFPIGGNATSPYTQETARYRVICGAVDTPTPRVTTVALLSTSTPTAAPTR